jgi:hypothetical protein
MPLSLIVRIQCEPKQVGQGAEAAGAQAAEEQQGMIEEKENKTRMKIINLGSVGFSFVECDDHEEGRAGSGEWKSQRLQPPRRGYRASESSEPAEQAIQEAMSGRLLFFCLFFIWPFLEWMDPSLINEAALFRASQLIKDPARPLRPAMASEVQDQPVQKQKSLGAASSLEAWRIRRAELERRRSLPMEDTAPASKGERWETEMSRGADSERGRRRGKRVSTRRRGERPRAALDLAHRSQARCDSDSDGEILVDDLGISEARLRITLLVD